MEEVKDQTKNKITKIEMDLFTFQLLFFFRRETIQQMANTLTKKPKIKTFGISKGIYAQGHQTKEVKKNPSEINPAIDNAIQ